MASICKKCGCKDGFTEAAPSTPTCEVVQCAAVMDANCVIYSGDPIVSGDTTIVNTGDTVSEAFNEIVNNLSIQTYKTFRGLLSQSGTSNPTLIILENTLGVSLTTFRDGEGQYKLFSSSPIFLDDKTFFNIQLNSLFQRKVEMAKASDSEFRINTYMPGESCCYGTIDDALTKSPIEIIVYE